MDTEFHYWITGIVAHAAGFTEEEAAVIAYSAEYVDENDRCLRIRDRSGGKDYFNFISQTMNILKPKDELMRIYPIFHFVPGEPDASTARRRDGRMHLLNCTPNSEHANALFDAAFQALEDTRLYRIGIASHTYADTWAHQNFIGWYDSHNGVGQHVLPFIGHMDAFYHPDWPAHHWIDTRLVDGEVNNTHRFMTAARFIYERYYAYLAGSGRHGQRTPWTILEQQLLEAIGRPFSGSENLYREARLEAYRTLVPFLKEFDEREWFEQAIETNVRGLPDSWDGILGELTLFADEYHWREDVERERTHWFRFQEAIKDHERLAIRLLTPIYGQMQLDIARL